MGCCGNKEKSLLDIPFEEIEEFNKLKEEINEIISNKESKNKIDSNKLLELLNKTSEKISEYEEELENLKNKQNKNENISEDLIKGISDDIKQLKEYNNILNNYIKENDNENKNIINININKQEEIINNENTLTHRDKKDKNELKNNQKNLKNIENIYFKKYIRRNKKSDILNKKNNIKKNFQQTDLFSFSKIGKNNELYNNNNLIEKNENYVSEVENNIINIIFVLENGKKVGIQVKKDDKFLKAFEKLGEKEEKYNNINNVTLFDGKNEITDLVKNGRNISSFEFNDYHFIWVKFISNN